MVKGRGNPANKSAVRGVSDAARDFDGGFSGRMAALIADFPSRKAASDAAGVTVDQLGRYIRGSSQPSFETVANMAAARSFSLDWVWDGTGPQKTDDAAGALDPSMVSVPVMDVRAGAGDEQYIVDETAIAALQLPRAFLIAHGIKPAFAKLMFCRGDSMEPTIRDSAPMVVDTSDQGERDGVYVMRRGNGIIVKRLQHFADGSLLMKSDNPAYEPEKLPRDEADELRAIGRVGLTLQSL